MNLDYFITRLSANKQVFASLLDGISDEQARWKPAPDKWSMLEVVNHLYDEERDDFRTRLDLTLHDPKRPWLPTDPPGWVIEREYNKRDPAESLRNFVQERDRTIEWLRTLPSPDWTSSHLHPSGFTLSAGDLLASWLAHDLLHIRQLARLHYHYITVVAPACNVAYAGEW
jgi:uncharacterized damage-inducible protein DinB